MLQLKDICKSYTTSDFTQVALDHVSVAFRDNEFVAVLGPSGSGKTTMLNIVGGLDHYDSGDLVIDGVSTSQYKDRDWDAYRNNRVGFVFQSYNLIPHQTILANVELALTLSGVSRAERRERALHELERVGLGDHVNKKPSQLSGGQMQRVAIARALINDPEILLADEPTGALDSKTSVQIMDLLTEIAAERLVVMVTHNPELAEQYATRIVTLADGQIRADTNPFAPTPADEHVSEKEVRRTRMSALTALSLSFKNLMTKKGRTLMTAFAGSIGIIGIAAILALANGVNNYIKTVEEETLSEYPLQIQSTGFDITSMLVGSGMGDDGSGGDGDGAADAGGAEGEEAADEVGIANMITSMFGSIGSNDLAALKDYLESGESGIESSVNAIEYFYNVEPQLFLPIEDTGGATDAADTTDAASTEPASDAASTAESSSTTSTAESAGTTGTPDTAEADATGSTATTSSEPASSTEPASPKVRQVNPDKSLSALGLGAGATSNSLMSTMMSTNVFFKMPSDEDLYVNQYDVLAGRWPENYNEVVLVTTQSGAISDFMLYTLGLRDSAELDDMVRQFAAEEDVEVPDDIAPVPFDDILDVTFRLVAASDWYSYDDEYDVWIDKSDDQDFMADLVRSGEEVRLVGIVKPSKDANATMLSPGVNYPASLTDHVIEQAAASDIVRKQLAEPTVNVFSGVSFLDEEDAEREAFDMSSLFTVNDAALESAFKINEEALSADLGNVSIDPSSLSFDTSKLPPFDPSTLAVNPSIDPSSLNLDFSKLSIDPSSISVASAIDTSKMAQAMGGAMSGFASWLPSQMQAHPEYASDMEAAMNAYMATPAVQQALNDGMASAIDTSQMQADIANAVSTQLQPQIQATISQQLVPAIEQSISASLEQSVAGAVQSYLQTAMASMAQQMGAAMQTQVQAALKQSMTQMTSNLQNALSIDPDAMASAFEFNMDEKELTELMTSLMNVEETSLENNLRKLGYADMDDPAEIDIYPLDFEAKAEVTRILDDYNARMEAEGKDDQVITYTDFVGALMTSVTDIINMISYVLIAFVAISLVVSSIMIGIITYISVLERKKEIGILRAIGASKGDVGRVFNAETIIVGFAAGCIGIGLTALACIPANMIVYALFDVANVAILPWQAAVILVGISVALTFVAGLFPSSAAAREDPVEALRSE
ncbi:ATP-binding cassette domain-containing protein [Eggerthellaceae bacterium zg-893]|nr:ATP-binding cassette domain-containing protein [Eggerthellaceae bacterium zg-893]